MIKVVMAIIITSMPNWPSVKYQGYLYPDMETCLTSTEMYVEEFRALLTAKEILMHTLIQYVLRLMHIQLKGLIKYN